MFTNDEVDAEDFKSSRNSQEFNGNFDDNHLPLENMTQRDEITDPLHEDPSDEVRFL